MSREWRITLVWTGTLLALGGVLVLVLPGMNVVPWSVFMLALGLGLLIGGMTAMNSAIQSERPESTISA